MNPFVCRSCGSGDGLPVLDLGLQPLANHLLRPEELTTAEPRFPLRVAVCRDCWLVQILDVIPPSELFSEYLYFSSVSDALLAHAADAAARHRRECALGAGSLVVEIASNDGYLLRNFVEAGIPCLGVEPARNIAEVARQRGIRTRTEFFGADCGRRIAAEEGTADLILGNNVFAHAPDTNDFVAGLAVLLKPGGRVVLEFPYACDLVEHGEFDTIYHEHVFYFTLTAVEPLLARHGLEAFDVERLDIHGGSLRLSLGHSGVHPVRDSVASLRREETDKGVGGPGYYQAFAARVHRLRDELIALLERLRAEGHRLCAYGASAKGSTLLNFYGLGRGGRDWIEFVVDRSPAKQGRLTPGSHLPILPVGELLTREPRHALLLTWNFADEILAQQAAWRAAGGHFIVPLPEVRIV